MDITSSRRKALDKIEIHRGKEQLRRCASRQTDREATGLVDVTDEKYLFMTPRSAVYCSDRKTFVTKVPVCRGDQEWDEGEGWEGWELVSRSSRCRMVFTRVSLFSPHLHPLLRLLSRLYTPD